MVMPLISVVKDELPVIDQLLRMFVRESVQLYGHGCCSSTSVSNGGVRQSKDAIPFMPGHAHRTLRVPAMLPGLPTLAGVPRRRRQTTIHRGPRRVPDSPALADTYFFSAPSA